MRRWILLLVLFPLTAFAGSQTYSTPGTYTFTVPAYGTMTATVNGAGGGGGGAQTIFVNGDDPNGGAGNYSSFGSVIGYGGDGGGGCGVRAAHYGAGGTSGTAMGGSSNTTGGGSGGGAGGGTCPTVNAAGLGGNGGKAVRTYASGELSPGAGISIVVGSAGLGGIPARTPIGNGSAGQNGSVTIAWADPCVVTYASYSATIAGTGNCQFTVPAGVTFIEALVQGPATLYNSSGGTWVSAGSGGTGSAVGSAVPGTSLAATIGSASGQITITWTPPAATCAVSLTPSAVNRGSSSTLSWSATNANTSVYIQNVGYMSGSIGSFSVAPSATTDYSCYAVGSGGTTGWHAASLTVYQSCTWNGSSVINGASVTAYQSDSVPYGQSCTSQSRTCNDGTLSGAYAYASCSVSHQSCIQNGVTVAHGDSHTFYSSQTAPVGNLCSSISQSRTCTDGVLSGSASYQYTACTCAPIYSCAGNDITYTNSSCSTSTVLSCTAPYLCSPGTSSCVSPDPEFNDDGTHTGHLQAQPQIVPPGLTTHIYWDVSNVESCTVSGNNGDHWSGLSGSKTSAPISQQTIYTLSCTPLTGGEFSSEQVTVNILPVFQEL